MLLSISFVLGARLLVAAVQHSATVIVLESQRAEFDDFCDRWRVWPELQPRMFVAIKNDTRRGQGLCQSVLSVLELDEMHAAGASSLIFEPDALPFAGVNYSALPALGYGARDVYFLGGHNMVYAPNYTVTAYWTQIIFQFGTYGMAISPRGRHKIVPRLATYCKSEQPTLSIDIFLSQCFDSVVATPLLVDHPRTGYSQTWQQAKTWQFAGNRFWWRPTAPVYIPKVSYQSYCL